MKIQERVDIDKNSRIKKEEDVNKWLNYVLNTAEIIDNRYKVKGTFVWLEYGLQIMQNIKSFCDSTLRSANIKEMHFPTLVPVEYFQINKKAFENFKEQVFWVHKLNEKKPKYVLKPTGESSIYPMFSIWINQYSDLPLKIYQNVPTYRYDSKDTRLLIRDREITFWYEIHTAHSTKKEAEKQIQIMINLKKEIWKNIAVTPLVLEKPQWDCLGIDADYKFYHLLPNGYVLENGSCTNLGQTHAKSYNIEFRKQDGTKDFVWQTNTGNGDRFLVAVLATHGDEKGIILPPSVSPIQVIMILIYSKNNRTSVERYAEKIEEKLKMVNIRIQIDSSELTIGKKYQKWEVKGIPLRIEIGQLEVNSDQVKIVRRDNGNMMVVPIDEIQTITQDILDSIQSDLHTKSHKYLQNHIKEIKNKDELRNIIGDGEIASALWCGMKSCSDEILENSSDVKFLGLKTTNRGKCVICKMQSNKIAYFARLF